MKNIIVNIIVLIGFVTSPFLSAKENNVIFSEISAIQKDYDRSVLDDYVAFNLYSMDREHEYFLGSAYRGYTLMHLTPDMAISKVGQQIASLREAINRSYTTLAIDESLRRQITSLAESLKILPSLSGGFSSELKSVWHKGMITLDQGLKRYNYIRTRMHAQMQVSGFTNKKYNPEDILLREITEFASHQDKIEAYAADFENDTHERAWTKRKAACGATARAIVYYFNKKGILAVRMEEAMKNPIRGIDSLISHLEMNQNQQTGYLYFSDTAKLDHAFIIQQTTDGRYRILQSFIDEYTLSAELAELTNDMSYDEIMDFARTLKTLLAAPQWNEDVAAMYQELFLTLPKDELHGEFEGMASDFSFVELPYFPQ